MVAVTTEARGHSRYGENPWNICEPRKKAVTLCGRVSRGERKKKKKRREDDKSPPYFHGACQSSARFGRRGSRDLRGPARAPFPLPARRLLFVIPTQPRLPGTSPIRGDLDGRPAALRCVTPCEGGIPGYDSAGRARSEPGPRHGRPCPDNLGAVTGLSRLHRRGVAQTRSMAATPGDAHGPTPSHAIPSSGGWRLQHFLLRHAGKAPECSTSDCARRLGGHPVSPPVAPRSGLHKGRGCHGAVEWRGHPSRAHFLHQYTSRARRSPMSPPPAAPFGAQTRPLFSFAPGYRNLNHGESARRGASGPRADPGGRLVRRHAVGAAAAAARVP